MDARRDQEYPGEVEQLARLVEDAAERLAPEITLYGSSSDPTTLQIDPGEFSSVLSTRLRVEWAIVHRYRETGRDPGGWGFADGLYADQGDDRGYTVSIGEQPLSGVEADIARNIDDILSGRPDDKPVVVLDFGGGLGLSWLRIASQPKYRTAIEDGRLAMVVTNLEPIPEQQPGSEDYTGIARSMSNANQISRCGRSDTYYPSSVLEWVQNNQGYVHYLDANALELGGRFIVLPNGVSMPLKHNVDVIHERLALEHTHVPDLALASFSALLSERGKLYSDAATYYHLMHPEQFSQITVEGGEVIQMTEQYSRQRRLALVIGSRMLQMQGLLYEVNDALHRGIFSRPPSPSRARP